MKKPLLWRDVLSISKALNKQLSWRQPADIAQAKELTNQLFGNHLHHDCHKHAYLLPCPGPDYVRTQLLTDKQKPQALAVKLATTNRRTELFGQRKTLYWTAEGQKQHGLILGTIGAGLTETTLATAINAFELGQSVFFIDAKGDNSLYAKVFSHLARSDSLADLVVVNLMTGGLEVPHRSKISHTVDLFGGMNAHELGQWLSFVCEGIFHTASTEEMADLYALLPYLAAVACAVSDDTTKPIDMDLIASLFDKTMLGDISQTLRNPPFANLAGQLHKRMWEGKGKDQIQEKFSVIKTHLDHMALAYPHVFTPQAELCLPNLNEAGRKFVLVMCPAMEKSTDELHTIPSCIIASYLTSVAKRSSVENVVEEMALFNSFTYLMTKKQFASIAKMRGKNVGMVFAGDDNSHKLRFDQLKDRYLLPSTTIIMKLERDTLSEVVVKYFNDTQAEGKLSLTYLANQLAGQAVYLDNNRCLPIWMDYKEAKKVNKLFITQHPIKDEDISPPPPRLYSRMLGENMDRVLLDRVRQMRVEGQVVSLSWCQETVARMLGYADFHEARRVLGG